jgi:hypothetical protein
MFSKKYVRSEWMEGLLEAEEMYKDDWSTHAIRQEFFYNNSGELVNGVYDYCQFVDQKNHEENITKDQ